MYGQITVNQSSSKKLTSYEQGGGEVLSGLTAREIGVKKKNTHLRAAEGRKGKGGGRAGRTTGTEYLMDTSNGQLSS